MKKTLLLSLAAFLLTLAGRPAVVLANYCTSNPCGEHGACYEAPDGYECSCYPGWTGTHCDVQTGATHLGMTWTLLNQLSGTITHVGADVSTDAYNGDTSPHTSLPILCINVDNSALPSGITPNFHNGWAKGHLALTAPVSGTTLTSLGQGNVYCIHQLGAGWRMAEHHDGWYGPGLTSQGGWSLIGYGNIPANTRFWVYINDQPANCWD